VQDSQSWQGGNAGTGDCLVPAFPFLELPSSHMFGFFKKLAAKAGSVTPGGKLDVLELTRRLSVDEAQLRAVPIAYRTFQVSKRAGGMRTLSAPADDLKKMQRRILRRVLAKLAAHPAATGFERGHSIVTNALPHIGKAVVIKLDMKDFFTATTAARVEEYFRAIGWNIEAAALLTRLCTNNGSLPQGAPTSPRLSNVVNYRLDARLAALAAARGISYSRYADDMTFSAAADTPRVNDLITAVKIIVNDEGYVLHTAKKLRIARQGDRQVVTGLVVNEKVNLPRATRRRLRAVEHHLKTGKPATLTAKQLDGWRALRSMIASQSASSA
jgi:RNA-directed DNA polymerase